MWYDRRMASKQRSNLRVLTELVHAGVIQKDSLIVEILKYMVSLGLHTFRACVGEHAAAQSIFDVTATESRGEKRANVTMCATHPLFFYSHMVLRTFLDYLVEH